MNSKIRERINQLKEKQNFKSDTDVIRNIYYFKRNRNEVGDLAENEYIRKTKGSFNQCFNGQRNFKPEDYLAIEYVLNSSMAYIIEGKGESDSRFELKGIRYSAITDTIGNYEKVIQDGILNSTDEYDKSIIDYMIDNKSKNGFIYFAERDMLPIGSTGGYNYNLNCIHYHNDNRVLLKTLCELLPINLLQKYFDFFLHGRYLEPLSFNERDNSSFTDEVIEVAINNRDLREYLGKTRRINLEKLNSVKRRDGQEYGDGLFANYGLSLFLGYAFNHEIDEEIRNELVEVSINTNNELLDFASKFSEEKLKIDKFGYLIDDYGFMCFGNIIVPPESNVELSEKTRELLEKLVIQVNNYHELISNRSKISIFANKIYAEKKENPAYYDFFKLMNEKGLKTIPLYEKAENDERDLFIVSDGNKSQQANGTDEQLFEIIVAIKEIDELSKKTLTNKTYFLVDPSIYVIGKKVNYIMPRDVYVSNKYSNLVYYINKYSVWSHYSTNKNRIKWILNVLKQYGIEKDELDEFVDSFEEIVQKYVESFDRKSERDKELAVVALENKALLEIYSDTLKTSF